MLCLPIHSVFTVLASYSDRNCETTILFAVIAKNSDMHCSRLNTVVCLVKLQFFLTVIF